MNAVLCPTVVIVLSNSISYVQRFTKWTSVSVTEIYLFIKWFADFQPNCEGREDHRFEW
jgi:hypothetical protein